MSQYDWTKGRIEEQPSASLNYQKSPYHAHPGLYIHGQRTHHSLNPNKLIKSEFERHGRMQKGCPCGAGFGHGHFV